MSAKDCRVEVFSRVTGFFRPVQSWNKGKTVEFEDRSGYRVNADALGTEDADSRITKSITG